MIINKCINCIYFLSCEKANEETKDCIDFVKRSNVNEI